MKLFLALLAISISAALAASLADADNDADHVRLEFDRYIARFGKVYAGAGERARRFAIFAENLRQINAHNNGKGKKASSWTQGLNQFSDLTHDEFVATLNGYVNLAQPGASYGASPASRDKGAVDLSRLPRSMDWRERKVVTPIKDQGRCGSCWAFAGTESVESYAAINNGTLVELSAQQMTSCVPNELKCGGVGGCFGGIPQLGFSYTQLFGMTTERIYPYVSGVSGQSEECHYDPVETKPKVYVRGYEVLARNDYAAVMDHLANKGPLSIAVAASSWSPYEGGVFNGCSFHSNIEINHNVQLVGYGTDEESGNDYWLVRNSWGDWWGENGYIRLLREATPRCGTDNTPLHGTACNNDGQVVQKVCGQCALLFDVTYPIGAYVVE